MASWSVCIDSHTISVNRITKKLLSSEEGTERLEVEDRGGKGFYYGPFCALQMLIILPIRKM